MENKKVGNMKEIKCINDNDLEFLNEINQDKIYKVIVEDKTHYKIINNNNNETWYRKYRFTEIYA